MSSSAKRFLVLLGLLLLFAAAAGTSAALKIGPFRPGKLDQAEVAEAKRLFGTLPPALPHPDEGLLGPERVDLGRRLYLETRLSKTGSISCNTCHPLDRFGADGEVTSKGHNGERGSRNTPTSFNAALHFAQFWDGRAATLEDQAVGPILNPKEMGLVESAVVTFLREHPSYPQQFKSAFPESDPAITLDNVGIAIGAFERRLITPSRFDSFLQGEADALTLDEQRGLRHFIEVGCVTCHTGPALGGSTYQKLGLRNEYPVEDQGRFDLTKREADRQVFKVPSLRNVSETGPYLHNGKVETLQEMIRLMAHIQLDEELSTSQVDEITLFLLSLRGSVDPRVLGPSKKD